MEFMSPESHLVRDQLDIHKKDQTELANRLSEEFKLSSELQKLDVGSTKDQYKIRQYGGFETTTCYTNLPGKNESYCPHYVGNYIDAYQCCMRLYMCGYCHNENERHSGDRSNTRL